jgi:hypothetical protein
MRGNERSCEGGKTTQIAKNCPPVDEQMVDLIIIIG